MAAEVSAATQVDGRGRGSRLFAAGGLIGALAASSCCILPLILFSVGVSGAWIGNFAALARYQWLFVTAALLCLGAGFYLVYRKPTRACDHRRTCAPQPSGRPTKLVLWIASALVFLAVAFPYVAPLLLDI